MMPAFEVSDLIDTLVDCVMGSMEFAIPTNEIRIEPRCRICRDETVRTRVNDLLKWRGVRIPLGRGKTHRVTYANVLRDLAPLNEGRDAKDRITYDCLWVHDNRHRNVVWTSADFRAWMADEWRKALVE
jgi:hypothetical protein